MQGTLKTPHYRIDDPQSGLAVQFRSVPVHTAAAPKIVASLVPTREATTFSTWAHAAACFAAFLAGQPLEIARVDA
jgi:hypothetical protein